MDDDALQDDVLLGAILLAHGHALQLVQDIEPIDDLFPSRAQVIRMVLKRWHMLTISVTCPKTVYWLFKCG